MRGNNGASEAMPPSLATPPAIHTTAWPSFMMPLTVGERAVHTQWISISLAAYCRLRRSNRSISRCSLPNALTTFTPGMASPTTAVISDQYVHSRPCIRCSFSPR